MKKQPSYTKAIILALILSILASGVLIYFQIKKVKNDVEENYKSMHGELSAKIFNRGYDAYIKEDENKEQLRCYASNMVEGINFTTIKMPFVNSLATTDIYRYYDADFNSILLDDTLIMAEKKDPDSKIYHYYTFQDEGLTGEIDKLVEQYGDEIGTVVFTIKNVYVKDDTFIPDEITCYAVGEGGSIGDQRTLYSAKKSKADMEADGYSLEQKSESFFLGESAIGDRSFVYCYGLNSERENRLNEVFQEAVNNSGGHPDNVYVRKDVNPFSIELYSVRKNNGKDEEHTYYVMAYEYMNTLVQPYSLSAAGGRGILYGEIYIYEMFFIVVLSIIIAAVIVKIRRKKA